MAVDDSIFIVTDNLLIVTLLELDSTRLWSYTSQETESIRGGTNASIVRIFQFTGQQIFKSIFAEERRRDQFTALVSTQAVRCSFISTVDPVGIQYAGNQVQLSSGTLKNHEMCL